MKSLFSPTTRITSITSAQNAKRIEEALVSQNRARLEMEYDLSAAMEGRAIGKASGFRLHRPSRQPNFHPYRACQGR